MILKRTLILITVLCTVIALCGIATAEDLTNPIIPQTFYGDVQVGGSPAQAGTTIEVRGEGVQMTLGNPLTVTVNGKFGGAGLLGNQLVVQGNITDGTPLTFWVNGVQAQIVTATGVQDSIPFESGANKTQVNLQAAAGGTEVTATATTSPPASGGGGGPSYHYSGGGGGGGGGSYSGFFDAPGSSSGNTTGTVPATQVTTSSPAAQKTGPASVTTVRTTLGPVPGVATSPPLGVSPILIGAIVIVIVAAAASGGYYMMQKGKKEGSKEEKIEEKKEL